VVRSTQAALGQIQRELAEAVSCLIYFQGTHRLSFRRALATPDPDFVVLLGNLRY
jgi:hypothetical protein